MAFKVHLVTTNDVCDKCSKVTDEQLFLIAQSTRTDRNFIYIHKSCLLKSIAKAEVPA